MKITTREKRIGVGVVLVLAVLGGFFMFRNQPATVSQVKVFYIAVNDRGKLGKKIGCDDSVVGVAKNVATTTAPLRTALNLLLNDKTRDHREAAHNLINVLYQSTLTLESVNIINGVATVSLKGEPRLGGVCDDPRLVAQLTETIRQFATVKEAKIYLNNVPLETAISEKGI